MEVLLVLFPRRALSAALCCEWAVSSLHLEAGQKCHSFEKPFETS